MLLTCFIILHKTIQGQSYHQNITIPPLPSPTEQGFNQYRKLVLNDFHLKKEQETEIKLTSGQFFDVCQNEAGYMSSACLV